MAPNIQLLDAVALTTDQPEKDLFRGQVGIVVFEVEFSDEQGRTYTQLPLRDSQFLVLHYQPQRAA